MFRQLFVVVVLMVVSSNSLSWPTWPTLPTLPSCEKDFPGDDSLVSLGCIIYSFCKTMKGTDVAKQQQVAQDFFGCYSGRLGEDQFTKCQKTKIGHLLDNVVNDQDACALKNLYKLPLYAGCLNDEFANSTVDKSQAVTAVNRCQGAALGFQVPA